MDKNSLLFWQPKTKYLHLFLDSAFSHFLLIFLNYIIWAFFFYVSYLLVKSNPNNFWVLFFATFISEIVERLLKSKQLWRRPLFDYITHTPKGLVDGWYKSGSFPSGHTIKTTFFLLFILQQQAIDPIIFLAVTLPLLGFRVLAGFHYPVDMIGGAIIGIIVWLTTFWIIMPQPLNDFIQNLFNFLFFIK